tara:strand:+ start:133021 stop:134130 length:1110 start_codon:yes stop_codon:yes gene_type:complete
MEIEHIVNLRHQLHRCPSLSNSEADTVELLEKYISKFNPTKVIKNLGGHGCCFLFHKNDKYPTVALRADLDALPIQEHNSLAYCSKHDGISHKCGHDGHMAMACGVLDYLDDIRANLLLVFQPAEETGEGAKRMINEPQFQNLKIDFIFGLHNLPGVAEHKILCKRDVFACSSVGMEIQFKGVSSHAAEPNKAQTPYPLVEVLLNYIKTNSHFELDEQFKIITMTHVSIGEKSFGITPGDGEIYLTLRAIKDEYIDKFKEDITKITQNASADVQISYHDDFPALKNNAEAYDLIKETGHHFDFEEMQYPFKWSEDFGHFTQKVKGAYFGIGVGENHFNLHHPEYDFNDGVLLTGIKFYKALIDTIANKE